MNSEQIFTLFIDVVEASQAFSIGLFLIFLNRKKKSSLLLLGIVLLVLGLSSLTSLINEIYKDLHLNFDIFILVPVFLYTYVDNMAILKKSKRTKAILAIGFLGAAIELSIGVLPLDQQEYIEDSVVYAIYFLCSAFFILGVFISIYIKVRQNMKALRNQYSSIENKDLIWVSYTIKFVFGFILLFGVILSSGVPELYADLILSGCGLFITYWVAYNGLLQQVSKNLIPEPDITENEPEQIIVKTEPQPEQNREVNLNRYQSVLQTIENLLEKEELFLNPDLTIANISEQINEHPRLISKVINTLHNENFNSFINRYRVEKAKSMLLDGQSNHLNIEGIGNESGFKSNSSFYAAFKKHENVTPLKFVKSLSN